MSIRTLQVTVVAVILTCLPSLASVGFANEREYKIKAAYLYNLAKFLDWPSKITDEFRLCANENTAAYKEIETINGKKVHNIRIKIKNLESISDDPSSCHMMFYSAESSVDNLSKILAGERYHSVLTVGENDAFLSSHGLIALVLEDNHVKLKINLKLAKQRDFKISGKLLEIAEVIE